MANEGIYLEKQIKNIDADIFICCGSSDNGHHTDGRNYSLGFLNNHG